MNKTKHIYNRLGLTLIKYIVISFFVALAVSIALYVLVQIVAMNSSHDKAFFDNQINETILDFQQYVTDNNISSTDYNQISLWNDDNWHVFLRIFKDNKVVYDTLISQKADSIVNFAEQSLAAHQQIYNINFADVTAKVAIMGFFRMRHQLFIKTVCYAMAFIVFVVVFLLLLNRKMRYIQQIEEGIKIIESGGLVYKIPVHGNDELASLAISINDMSKAMNEKLESEKAMEKERDELTSAISHDIRLPLTSIICYLDLIVDKKYDTPQKHDEYAFKAQSKAYQMKELTDNLFEFSLASNVAVDFKYEIVNGNEFVAQLISECIFILEDKGFKLNFEDKSECSYLITADVQQIKRVFDNIYTNIIKYADEKFDVNFKTEICDNTLIITQSNTVSAKSAKVESSKIGIKTCEKILARHDGSVTAETLGNEFFMKIKIPVELLEN